MSSRGSNACIQRLQVYSVSVLAQLDAAALSARGILAARSRIQVDGHNDNIYHGGFFYPAETRFLESGRSEKFAFVVWSGGVARFYIRPRSKFLLSR
jgi:hypothetical protein